MLAVPKIFSAGSKLVFRPEKDVAGTLKIMIFPVDLPPGVKDLMYVTCLSVTLIFASRLLSCIVIFVQKEIFSFYLLEEQFRTGRAI